MNDEPLFRSVHNALLFAHNYNHSQYDKNTLAKLIKDTMARRAGKGLSGLDGAAQAGLILGAIRDIGTIEAAIATSRYASSRVGVDPIYGLRGDTKMNPVWQEANALLAKTVVADALAGCRNLGMVRQSLVAKYFGFKWPLAELAKWADIDRTVLTRHWVIVKATLEREEAKAMKKIDARMWRDGLVEG